MSLYIPHVFSNFTAEYIAGVFSTMGIGNVDHVDLVAKLDKHGNPYNAAYIHFRHWYNSPTAVNFQERVKDPNRDAKLVHDEPWYWIVLENTAKKHVPGEKKICIDLAPGLSANYDEVHEYEDEEDDDYEEGEELNEDAVRMATTHEEECHIIMAYQKSEISQLTEQLINQNRSLLQSDEYLCEAQKENFKMEAELQEAQQEIIDKELDLQNAHHLLEMIMQRILGAKTLEEAKDVICAEMWGISYGDYSEDRGQEMD